MYKDDSKYTCILFPDNTRIPIPNTICNMQYAKTLRIFHDKRYFYEIKITCTFVVILHRKDIQTKRYLNATRDKLSVLYNLCH